MALWRRAFPAAGDAESMSWEKNRAISCCSDTWITLGCGCERSPYLGKDAAGSAQTLQYPEQGKNACEIEIARCFCLASCTRTIAAYLGQVQTF
jgi:hypothetical protein